ncbi:dTDP-4-dehydrorhamnose 3,5-epimerase family protein [Pedobacter sp. BMA]|uniref:dTDP-4-dehydrorhamnose 3,5-epimerase family protein n=1 Tax=Pedobacter sp. BMA TaxID=1663685 RepID=UPI00064B65E6|nr:dTDP-4-dehydrorhamnose 3,5-epimerase family protein [Pedobacter sp. BMA]KLT64024.1 dTDP-4-dehydrorhamnose 3,5-epimerase [Pedobacter sp. BMA]
MEIKETPFHDLFIMDYKSFVDNRGEFVKTIHKETFQAKNLDYNFTESFYSVSNKDVIRGMHYQVPPEDHSKLVYVVTGAIIDVVLDIRKNSETFGSFFFAELSAKNRKGIYIGKGFAHGFLSLEDNTTVEYHTSTSQSRECEAGIKFDSFGYDWDVQTPILSDRDLSFETFSNIKSPF